MEFTNTFTVPTDIDTAWATLTDLEKVAPCLPGATLEEVDGEVYTGKVKVKVGPITVTYRGTAELVEADEEKRAARIKASGKEMRGSGTANADVSAQLTEREDGTLVEVVTDLNVTGKPAQFGRGVMADVGAKIIGTFAERLEELVLSDDAAGKAAAEGAPPEETETSPAEMKTDAASEGAAAAAATDAAAAAIDAPAASTGPRRIAQDPSREDDALNLVEVAGAATAKRVIPLVAALAAVAALIWWLRRR